MNRGSRSALPGAVVILLLSSGRAQVTEDWTVSYNGPAGRSDYAYAIAVDKAGNVFVAGEARTGASTTDSIDYALIKYGPTGDTLWVRFYNGSGNKRDVVRAVAVDDSGNVYVTGESYGTSDYDIATVKYSSGGSEQWARRYNGPANGADGAAAIAVDALGNVYVTGYSDGDASTVFRQDDFVTIKYTPSGDPAWTKRYNGPGAFHDVPHAIGVDGGGNVFVTGESVGSGSRYDYATVRYLPSGDTGWVRRYNGPANYDDRAWGLALDARGSVTVTGSSDGTSSDNEDYCTIKYDSAGTQLWLARYDGPGGGDEAFAIAGDGGTSIYVTGWSRGPGPAYTYDYLTIRYNAATGDSIWTARYDGDGKGIDAAVSVAARDDGRVFVTGYSAGASSGYDFATLAYDSTGLRRWASRYSSSGTFNDLGTAVALDAANHIYVTGTGFETGEQENFVTIKYTDDGSPVGVDLQGAPRPKGFALAQNFPNPFNPTTVISYQLPVVSDVSLVVFDVLGREVAVLANERMEAGVHEVKFEGSSIASGVYFYRLTAGSSALTRKLVLLK